MTQSQNPGTSAGNPTRTPQEIFEELLAEARREVGDDRRRLVQAVQGKVMQAVGRPPAGLNVSGRELFAAFGNELKTLRRRLGLR